MDARPAAIAELVETSLALPRGIVPLALRAVLLAFALPEQRRVVFVVCLPRLERSPVTLS